MSDSTHVVAVGRRRFLLATGVGIASCLTTYSVTAQAQESHKMYGLIGKINSIPGQRDALIAFLIAASSEMPGCLSYVVAKDPDDDSGIWITEVWDSEASHTASLTLPSVKEAIAKGRPLIAGFSQRVVTMPVGGHGLAAK